MTALPELEKELLNTHARLSRRNRWSRARLARRADATGTPPADAGLHRSRWVTSTPATAALLLSVAVTVAIVVVALTALRSAHTSGHGPDRGHTTATRPAVGTSTGTTDRRQALALYAPVVTFDRSTTRQQRAEARAALATATRRINACQRLYSQSLFRSPVGTTLNKVYDLYEAGLTLENYQLRETAIAPQVAAAGRSWARMRLANPTLERVARSLAAEIPASITAPKLNGCTFLHALARHRFSYAWARRSAYVAAERRFTRITNHAASGLSLGDSYVLHTHHLLTARQWSGIVNFPGIVG